MFSRRTRDLLKRLAEELVSDDAEGSDGRKYGLRSGAIPERLAPEAGDERHLTVNGLANALFHASAASLRTQAETEHLRPKEIDEALWDLTCEFRVRQTQYRNVKARNARLGDFENSVARPWIEFEALIVVRNLALSDVGLEVLGVSFSRWPGSLQPLWQDTLEARHSLADWPGRTIATTVVRAGDAAHAIRRAQIKVDDALDMLRLGIQGSVMLRLDERELLFDRSPTCIVRSLPDRSTVAQTWGSNFAPIPATLSREFSERVSSTLAPMNGTVGRNDLRDELRDRIVRAGRWIGRAATREDPDDKALNLIAALESLLTFKGDPRKGEAIALRSMLLPSALGDGFPDPGLLLYAYEQRSKLVHGSAVRVFSMQDYHELYDRVTTILNQVVELLARRPTIRRFHQLLEAIQTRDALRAFADLLDNDHPGAPALQQLALELLARMDESARS